MAGLTPGAQKWHLPPCCSCANGQCLSTKANSTTGPLEHSHTAPGSAGQLVLSSTAPAPLLLLICCHAPVQSQSNPNLEQSEQHPPLSVPMPGLEAPRQTPILHIQRRDPPSVRAGGSLSNVRRRNSLGPVTPVWRGQTPLGYSCCYLQRLAPSQGCPENAPLSATHPAWWRAALMAPSHGTLRSLVLGDIHPGTGIHS